MNYDEVTCVSLVLVSRCHCGALWAQTGAGTLHGQVTDPSGAAIPGASVIMTPATGSPIVVQSNGQGIYEFKNLPAGKYTLTVAAPGFTSLRERQRRDRRSASAAQRRHDD